MSRSSSTSRICGSSAMARLPRAARPAGQHKNVALCRQLCRPMSARITPAMSEAAELAKAALARGDLIAAYDLTGVGDRRRRREQRRSATSRSSRWRAWATPNGRWTCSRRYGLDRSADPHERAVGARLLKDRALALPAGPGTVRRARAGVRGLSCHLSRSGDAFPGINAATLALLAGEEARAGELAAALLADPPSPPPAIITAPPPRPRRC